LGSVFRHHGSLLEPSVCWCFKGRQSQDVSNYTAQTRIHLSEQDTLLTV